jgi:hypothetical protein
MCITPFLITIIYYKKFFYFSIKNKIFVIIVDIERINFVKIPRLFSEVMNKLFI